MQIGVMKSMLPCQSTCAAYCEGCHKTCARWRRSQEEQQRQREAKKRYLEYHSPRCTQTARQLLRLHMSRSAW